MIPESFYTLKKNVNTVFLEQWDDILHKQKSFQDEGVQYKITQREIHEVYNKIPLLGNWTRESAGESWDVNDVTLVTVLAESIDDTGSVFHTEAWAALYINEPHWTQHRIFPNAQIKQFIMSMHVN